MNEKILAAGPSSSQPTLLFRQQQQQQQQQTALVAPAPLPPSTSSLRYQIISQTPPMSRLTGDRSITTPSSNTSTTSSTSATATTPNNSTNQPHQQQSNLQQTSGSNNSHSVTTTVLATVVNSNDDGGDGSEQDRKRIKVENEFSSCNDLAALKRRILEHKYMRLKSVKEKYSEHVAELFFLQSNMNMMEYPTWRKKPQSPEFMNFVRAHRLDQTPLDDLAVSFSLYISYTLHLITISSQPH